MPHRTKDKGDQGFGYVVADLIANGIKVCVPLSDHLAFDLVAVSDLGQLKRVQVKYKSSKEGVLEIDRRKQLGLGRHTPREREAVDVYAVFCPETRSIYYVRSEELASSSTFTLRLDEPGGRNTRNSRMAADFIDATRIW